MGVKGMTPWKCDDRKGSETSEASGDVIAKQRQSQFHNAHSLSKWAVKYRETLTNICAFGGAWRMMRANEDEIRRSIPCYRYITRSPEGADSAVRF